MARDVSEDPLAYTPAVDRSRRPTVGASQTVPSLRVVTGFFVGTDGSVPRELGADRVRLDMIGFDRKVGSAVVASMSDQSLNFAVGIGKSGSANAATLRDAQERSRARPPTTSDWRSCCQPTAQ